MNKTIRLALIGASILALTSPVLAQSQAKSDRMTSHRATGGGEYNTAPVFLRERARAPAPVRLEREHRLRSRFLALCGRRQLSFRVSLLDIAYAAAGRKASRFRSSGMRSEIHRPGQSSTFGR